MAHEVTLIPGDGTGPELAEATRRVLEATGVALAWDVQEAGIDEYESSGNPFPPATPDSLKRTKVGIPWCSRRHTARRPSTRGRTKMNPTALMLSGVYLLAHPGEQDAAGRLESAIAEVIRRGEKVTYDLKANRDDPTAVGTSQFADAVIEEMGS